MTLLRIAPFVLLSASLWTACSTRPTEEPKAVPAAPAPSGSTAADPAASWLRFGGPDGNFRVEGKGLAANWPAEGPPVIWQRDIGAGYSAIAADGNRLYTMYREGENDVVTALDPATGKTEWEHRYPAPAREQNATQFGVGPNATPLVMADRIVTLGYSGLLHGLDAATGEVLWTVDLIRDLGGQVLDFGSSASPIEVGGNVIVLVGGDQQGVAALSPADGSVVWRGKPSSVSYATPIVIDVDGQDQLIYFSAEEIIGLDPANEGAFLWSFPVVNQYANNCTPPQWGDDHLLWVATQLDGGTRALRLTREGETTSVEEVWSSNEISLHYWNTLRLGNHVYASIGSNGSILAGIDVASGEIAWRERGFTKVNFLQAGKRTILLDAEGRLALAELSPQGILLVSQTQILEAPTWTVPTLVGTRMYVRNQKSMVALELGEGSAAPG